MGVYHNIAEYSPVHKMVLFGGGNGSSDLYKLDAKGKVTTLKKTPIGVGTMQSIVTLDPVSGDFLVFGKNGSFYVYDVAATMEEAGGRGADLRAHAREGQQGLARDGDAGQHLRRDHVREVLSRRPAAGLGLPVQAFRGPCPN